MGDVRGAFLDVAISVEAFMKQKLMASLDPLLNDEPAIRKRLETWNITEVLNNYEKVHTIRSLQLTPEVIAVLRRSLETRNSIMHGKSVDLDEAILKSTLYEIKGIFNA